MEKRSALFLKSGFICWCLCIGIAQLLPNFGLAAGTCRESIISIEHSILVQAYEFFLNAPKESTAELPTSIHFRNSDYKVTHFLGEGKQGRVFKVEDKKGKKSIIKIFKNPSLLFLAEVAPMCICI